MSEKPQQSGWNRKMVALVAVLLILMAGLMVPVMSKVMCERSFQVNRCKQCRQIVIALKSYAGDVCGNYPDAAKESEPKTSNQAFRMLFVRGLLDDERDFGGNGSSFVPDGDFGEAPDFKRALEPGENHWAMTAELSDSAAGFTPLVYENTSDDTWPPKWVKTEEKGRMLGRLPSQGKVVVGRNDGSVNAEQPKLSSEGRWILEDSARLVDKGRFSKLRILNVEE